MINILCPGCSKIVEDTGEVPFSVFQVIFEHQMLHDLPIIIEDDHKEENILFIRYYKVLEKEKFILSTEWGQNHLIFWPLGYYQNKNQSVVFCLKKCIHAKSC